LVWVGRWLGCRMVVVVVGLVVVGVWCWVVVGGLRGCWGGVGLRLGCLMGLSLWLVLLMVVGWCLGWCLWIVVGMVGVLGVGVLLVVLGVGVLWVVLGVLWVGFWVWWVGGLGMSVLRGLVWCL
jgi:hypothetical protein